MIKVQLLNSWTATIAILQAVLESARFVVSKVKLFKSLEIFVKYFKCPLRLGK